MLGKTIVPALAALLLAAPAAAEVKIGYVDFQRALNEVEEGKGARASLKRDFDEKQKILDREKNDLERMQADFEKQAAVMNDDAKRDRIVEMEKKGREAAMKLQQFQKELSEREREVTRVIFDKMVSITREIADGEGFTLVFEKNDSGLVVAPSSLDLTNELVRKYNARHKAGGEPAPAKKGPEKAPEKKKDAEKKPPAQAK